MISKYTDPNYGRATRPSGDHPVLESQCAERYPAAAPSFDYWEPSPRAVRIGWRTSLLGAAVFGFFCMAPWVMTWPQPARFAAGCVAFVVGAVALCRTR